MSTDADLLKMLQDDNKRMRAAGTALAEAALHVIREYDGCHRLSLAVAEWAKALANEGGRENRHASVSTPTAKGQHKGWPIKAAPKDRPILVYGGAPYHGGPTYGFRVLTINEERHLFAANGGFFPWTPTLYWDLPDAPTSSSKSLGESS